MSLRIDRSFFGPAACLVALALSGGLGAACSQSPSQDPASHCDPVLGEAPQGCGADAAQSLYLLGQGRELALYHPATKDLKVLGTLSCPGQSDAGAPFSMAVDRGGKAWILFANGSLYTVDTATLECEKADYKPCQDGFCTFSMAFAADAPGSEKEALYLAGNYNVMDGRGLAKLDTSTLKLTKIADYDMSAGAALEITGAGDGKLFGYLRADTGTLLEIDPATARVALAQSLLSDQASTYQAVASWGDHFYFASGTSLYDFDPDTAASASLEEDVGFPIEAAAVSTCAIAAQETASSCAAGGDTGAPVGDPSPDPSGECDKERTETVYLLGQGMELARFEPRTGQLTPPSKLSCPGLEDPSSLGASIAVDRRGTAWIIAYPAGAVPGQLYKVDLATLACTAAGMSLCKGADVFDCITSMAFAGGAGGEETLYGAATSRYATIDPKALAVTHESAFDAIDSNIFSLAGAADGRLFCSIFESDGTHLMEIDPANAKVLSNEIMPLEKHYIGGAALWGGKAYVAKGRSLDSYDLATKKTVRIVDDVGFDLADAGTSTCAPATASK